MLAVLVSGLLAAGAVQAAAQDNTWYVGGKAGWSNYYGVDHNQYAESIAQTLGNTSENTDDLGLGLFAGYQLNPNLGFELGYDWLGKYDTTSGTGANTLKTEAKSQMIQATMKISFPATNVLDLYGRLGGAYAWTDSEISFANSSETGKSMAPPSLVRWVPNTPSIVTGPPVWSTSTLRRWVMRLSIAPASRWITA